MTLLVRKRLVSRPVALRATAMERCFFYVSVAAALAYALLAGLRTVSDFDLGWQLASGRWIVQHHHIPSVDVFSYTAQGVPWIYPVGSGLLFYGAFLLRGYALLSWMGAIACAGTVVLLLRRGNLVTAALALLAIPSIASRTTPRADMFTVVLFAAFLSLLWEQHETGQARLWLLPVLMVAWVNLHLGFVAGLALLAAYGFIEILDCVLADRRATAIARLRRAVPWLLATCGATLVNPWGWNVYAALFRQQAVTAAHSQEIVEWAAARINGASLARAFLLRGPEDSAYLLVIFSAAAILLALWRSKFGAAALLAGAAVLGLRHVRFLPLFAEVAVVIGGAVVGPEIICLWARINGGHTRSVLAAVAVGVLVLVAGVRSFDVVTNRTALASTDLGWFGTGLSWWFPERAAAFVEREALPAQIFNEYNTGGFLAWRLGEKYPDYIDGRAIPFGMELIRRNGELVMSAPESAEWQQEVERYRIRTMIISLGRYDALQFFPLLRQYCNSNIWAPVYLDEVAAVFVWRSPETQALIERARIDCATAPLPLETPDVNDAKAFNQWANAAALLQALGRNSEALTASGKALDIFSGSAYVHFLRGNLLNESGDLPAAEEQYRMATRLENHAAPWSALAELYKKQGRKNDAIAAWEQAADLERDPQMTWLQVGYAYLGINRPQDALNTFERIDSTSNSSADSAFLANVAHGRAAAYLALGNVARATNLEEEALQLAPDRASDWLWLASLYQQQGRSQDAENARQRAMAIGQR